MIETKGLTKRFDDILAVDHISAKIRDGSVFGLIGTNGAGKSTFLRMVSGILKPDEGEVLIDGENVYENPAVKSRFFYISDDQYFFANGTPLELMKFYKSIYPAFDEPRFFHLLQSFDLDKKRKISTFSKGMKKQLSILYGICAGTDYIFCDETFDGLDPVMRRQVWSLMMGDVAERGTTVLVSSHNLRELEDVCDHVGIMDHGHVLLERSLAQLQDNMVKLQVVFPDGMEDVPAELPVLHASKLGRVHTLIMRMNAQEATERLMAYSPLLVDAVPLTLEEIFIYELGGADYAVKDIVL